MERRKFISSSIKTGIFGCAAICIGENSSCFPGLISKNSEGSSCEKKYDFSQTWIKRFMNNLSSELDKERAEKLMELNGKTCYLGSLEHRNLKKEDIPAASPEELVNGIKQYTGEDAASIDGNVIYFKYVKNPEGLRVEDGYCLCPFVESGPEGLSPLYCHCSVGYVKEMFETYLKKNVNVELITSLKRGDKTCSFKITMS